LPQPRSRLHEVIEDLPDDDPHWWSEDRVKYFLRQLSPKHNTLAKIMVAKLRYSYATAFRRVRNGKSMAELRVDGIAGCLRTPRGGSGRQILLKAGRGKYKVRLLTARECARLQGVPESYKIDVPLNQALFGFGDAVCIPAVEWIAKHYLAHEASVCDHPLFAISSGR
jgi:DNA (cytosine-5)-methyltransferase 1